MISMVSPETLASALEAACYLGTMAAVVVSFLFSVRA
jgi:hypothetical protein